MTGRPCTRGCVCAKHRWTRLKQPGSLDVREVDHQRLREAAQRVLELIREKNLDLKTDSRVVALERELKAEEGFRAARRPINAGT